MNLDHISGNEFHLDGYIFDRQEAIEYLKESDWSEREATDFLDLLARENQRDILRQMKCADEI